MAERQQHRDGRTTDTRQLILKEAEKLYYTGGYDHISLQVIADHLQISKAALFHHFKNKRELFFEMLLMILAHMREMFESVLNEEGLSTRQRLYLAMHRLSQESTFDMMRFQREEYPLLNAEQQNKADRRWHADMFDIVQRVFREGVERGELENHDVTLSTYLFLNTCLLLTPNDSIEMKASNKDVYINGLLDMLLNGLSKK